MKFKKDDLIILLVFVAIILQFVIGSAIEAHADYVNSIDGLCVRSEANKKSDVVRILPFASEIDVEGSSRWLKVEDGYVRSKYVQKTNPLDDLEFLGAWRVTAYAETGYCCANGSYPSIGYTIAHNSLPFGTKVYIAGVGVRVVEDRGPSYLGNEWCDLYLGDVASCITWGDQTCNVYLID